MSTTYTWEETWTEEQVQRMHTYFLHDKRNGASLCLICTAKDDWLATWWKKMIEQYEEDSTNDEEQMQPRAGVSVANSQEEVSDDNIYLYPF